MLVSSWTRDARGGNRHGSTYGCITIGLFHEFLSLCLLERLTTPPQSKESPEHSSSPILPYPFPALCLQLQVTNKAFPPWGTKSYALELISKEGHAAHCP